jgi:hypothetical protein
MRRLRLTAVGFLIVGSGVSLGQTASALLNLRVRLLNYKTGRPLKGRYVELVLSGPDGKFPNRPELMRAETDTNGVAEFRFETMSPPRVWILTLDDYPCAEQEQFATADIHQHGIAVSYADDSRCKPHAATLPSPQPGEVLFPVRRLNLWQRLVRGLE